MKTMEKELDRDFLYSYYKDMVDEIGEIFELFLNEMPGDLIQIKEKIAAENFNEVALLLHKVAPCFYNVGLPSLTKMAQEMEALIHDNKTVDAVILFKVFETELEEYMPAIIQESERLKSL